MPPSNLVAPPVSGQILNAAAATDAGVPAILQVPPPINAPQPEIDPNINCTNSTESSVNLDPPLAPAPNLAPAHDHCSSLAMANKRMTPSNNLIQPWQGLPTTFTPYKPSRKSLAPSLINFKPNNCAFNAKFKNKFMLRTHILPPLPNKCNNSFQQPPLPPQHAITHQQGTSPFHGKEPRDIYITNDTFWETKLALAYGCPPVDQTESAIHGYSV
uniref:Uncharacterized protein n=1 Tax=Romanomermis culicivorax TaxID=13658 RepID=A0A915KV46_ROMCU